MVMFHHPYIASGGGDIIPLVIIVIAILAQIIKVAKGAKPGISKPGQQQSDGGGYTAPEDELKKFLESLSGKIPIPEINDAPPPLPLPVSQRQVRKIKTQESVSIPVIKEVLTVESAYDIRESNKPVLASSPPPPPEVPQPAMASDRYDKPATVHIRRETSQFRADLVHELIKRESIRKAVVLREILGPCIALRRPGTLVSGL